MMNKLPEFPVKKKAGRPKKEVQVNEIDKLKNLIGRQDDMIAQLSDEIKRLEKVCETYDSDIDLLEGNIVSYREILKTLLEITE
jgi:peptidoglycan hydrolase CwlO-like protein